MNTQEIDKQIRSMPTGEIIKCTCKNSLEYSNCDKNCERRIAEMEEDRLHKKQYMGIINQLFDLAEVSVDKRQAINDTADQYLAKWISENFVPKKEMTSDEMDLIQYVINLLYAAYVQPNDNDKFEKWADEQVENLREYYSSFKGALPEISGEEIEKHFRTIYFASVQDYDHARRLRAALDAIKWYRSQLQKVSGEKVERKERHCCSCKYWATNVHNEPCFKCVFLKNWEPKV